jgi:oxazoline/thiazoline dehydrogenase
VSWSWQTPGCFGEERHVFLDGEPLATLVRNSPYFKPRPGDGAAGAAYRLSRFAYIRAEAGESVLESPAAHSRVVLKHWRAAATVHKLAKGCRVEDIATDLSLSAEAAAELVGLFVEAGMVSEVSSDGETPEDASATLRQWEFHDLLFHARSRAGRHDGATGGTYRFLNKLDPAPILKSMPSECSVELYKPDLTRLEQEDPPFAAVQEARVSIREYGPPLSVQQLGEFLYRVGRVADYWQIRSATPTGSLVLDTAPRPYPAGGGLYELELYPLVSRCDGVDAGLYHYNPERHCLDAVPADPEDVRSLLRDAGRSTSIQPEHLQVVIFISARFQRISWKYASIAYSVILKDAGVLYQTMYLAATAMGLAPCGVGCGNSDLFARAIGSDYYAESSVGEFLLGTRAD